MSSYVSRDQRCLWHPFTQHTVWENTENLVIVRADGCWLYDDAGNRYLDGVSSLWTNVHGHRIPEIDEAVRQQLESMAHSTFLGLTHPPAIELAEALLAVAPPGLSRVFFSDNGSTAVEVALKIAFQFHQQNGSPERTRFLTLSDAYHGDTLGSVSVGGIEKFHELYRPLLFKTYSIPAPRCADAVQESAALELAARLLSEQGHTFAAFIFEPLVQGAAGIKMHSPEFIRTLSLMCRKAGLLLIADEVAVGFGRTGTLFAMEQVGISPDLFCLAKGISGGYLPLAATLTTEALFDGFRGAPAEARQLFHGHTYTANPLACMAALASLNLFHKKDILLHVGNMSASIDIALQSLRQLPWVGDCRSLGVLAGIDLRQPDGSPFPTDRQVGSKVCQAIRRHGIILRPLGDTIVINPPLSIHLEELLHLFTGLRHAIIEVCDGNPT